MIKIEELKTGTTAQGGQSLIEHLWLTYYNDTLFAAGLITEEQRNKMRVMINSRTHARRKDDKLGGNRDQR